MTNNIVDLFGGNERAKYFISLGHLWQNSLIRDFAPPAIYKNGNINKNYYYKRYNFRSNLGVSANPSLNFKLDVSGNYDERNSLNIGRYGVFFEMGSYKLLSPFAYNIYNLDGNYGFTNGQLIPKPAEGNTNNFIGRLALQLQPRIWQSDEHLGLGYSGGTPVRALNPSRFTKL